MYQHLFKSAKSKTEGKNEPAETDPKDKTEDMTDPQDQKKSKAKGKMTKTDSPSFGQMRQAAVAKLFGA